jgi:hypothetical protein
MRIDGQRPSVPALPGRQGGDHQELRPHPRNEPEKQGILPLTFANAADYDKFEEKDRVSITGLSALAPGKPVDVTIHKASGGREDPGQSFNDGAADRLVQGRVGAERAGIKRPQRHNRAGGQETIRPIIF